MYVCMCISVHLLMYMDNVYVKVCIYTHMLICVNMFIFLCLYMYAICFVFEQFAHARASSCFVAHAGFMLLHKFALLERWPGGSAQLPPSQTMCSI